MKVKQLTGSPLALLGDRDVHERVRFSRPERRAEPAAGCMAEHGLSGFGHGCSNPRHLLRRLGRVRPLANSAWRSGRARTSQVLATRAPSGARRRMHGGTRALGIRTWISESTSPIATTWSCETAR